MAGDQPDPKHDAKRLVADIENAAARLKQTIEPPRDDGLSPPPQTPRPGLLARLFGRRR